MIEVSAPTIILFCVIRNDVDDLYKWQTFRPSSLHQRQISHAERIAEPHADRIADPHAKSGTDEGYWAEMFAIYINHQDLHGLHKR